VPTDKVLPDPETSANTLWNIVLASEIAATTSSGAQVLSDLGLSMTFDTENPLVLDYLRHKELRVKTIPGELYKELRAELLAGNAAGEPIERISERVSSVYEDVKGYRARRIAQTEIVGAYNVGNIAGMDIAGVAQKEWVATLDDRVRDTHADVHGEQVGIGEEFSNGLQFPGDPLGEAGEVINCRCTVVAV
jgi:SPP1 gp7 family putative phage head morphogenesis protein